MAAERWTFGDGLSFAQQLNRIPEVPTIINGLTQLQGWYQIN